LIISIIAGIGENWGIGLDNKLPWRLSDDLRRFKELRPRDIGRKTFQSIGRPLPRRDNYILTTRRDFQAQGCLTCHSLNDAIMLTHQIGAQEIFIIGGATIYQLCIDIAARIYLTFVHGLPKADTFFPEINWDDWGETYTEFITANEKNDFPSTYKILERIA